MILKLFYPIFPSEEDTQKDHIQRNCKSKEQWENIQKNTFSHGK